MKKKNHFFYIFIFLFIKKKINKKIYILIIKNFKNFKTTKSTNYNYFEKNIDFIKIDFIKIYFYLC
jgi:hypothetical protein